MFLYLITDGDYINENEDHSVCSTDEQILMDAIVIQASNVRDARVINAIEHFARVKGLDPFQVVVNKLGEPLLHSMSPID